MEYVCNDSDGSKWYFDPNASLYFRIAGEAITAKIFGKYLPNPSLIKASQKRDASEATQLLWSHWNAK